MVPKGHDDYLDTNLSNLYELEGRRQKMCDMAEERMKKGESLSSPELLRESNDFNQLMVDDKMLENLANQLKDEDGEELTPEQKNDKTNTGEKNTAKTKKNGAKEGEQTD